MELDRETFDLTHGTFHALTGGDPTGHPVIYLHGFPDHPPTATPFLTELCRSGHKVLAPWLRGYAPSPTKGAFDQKTLLGDVIELIDRWSPERPVDFVGHDWGSGLTCLACIAVPDRIASAVTIAVPHPLTFMRQLARPSQLRHSWYMGLFQIPGAGWVVSARDLSLVDFLWRRWSPGFSLDPARRAELHRCLAASMPAPIKYYRQMLRPYTGARPRLRQLAQPITTPLLQLHGADDGCVLPPSEDDSHRFAGPHELRVLEGLGHFLHLEAPEAVAEQVATWCAEKSG
jgi:pimeloyl-ACP methyl ester carboxylesterase